ncbi:DNA repair protein [Aspergillus luchuensis]|uniref:DNA repair protein n=1 Tax=Aspergillus kawachii TaxID=1069201 RepID=A0A146FN50_ASPKA|nr:DNA repair protein [Aspergillus luchuensis]
MHRTVVPRQSSAHRFASKFLQRQQYLLSVTKSLTDCCFPFQLWHFIERSSDNAPNYHILPPNSLRASRTSRIDSTDTKRFRVRLKQPIHLGQATRCVNNRLSIDHSVSKFRDFANTQALDLLYSASQGDQNGVQRIRKLISESEAAKRQKSEWHRERAKVIPVKPVSRKELKKEANKRYRVLTAKRHPDATSILARPRPVVNGKRRVPVLVNARGFPFLLIKKPQPKFLSAVLDSKLKRRWKRMERLKRLESELPMARDEDEWDLLTGHKEDAKWAGPIRVSLKEVQGQISEGDRRTKELAQAMWKVVLEERKLAEQEEKQRVERAGEQPAVEKGNPSAEEHDKKRPSEG